jgi:two-component system catabolic regulation response regulator CreB/two-component system response regulator ChvI
MTTELEYPQIDSKKSLYIPQSVVDYSEGKRYQQTLISKTSPTEIKRVMIVDDNADVNLTFKIVLGESDRRLRVYSFSDPIDALQSFRPDIYNLIIIDILMPKLNGFELYDKLRKLDSKVKICFLTAANEIHYEDMIKEAFPELDVNSFIRKPIANRDLIKQVKEILELK